MFNLKNHLLQKTANYEGVQGYFVAQTRAWQNCVACKQKDKKSAQEAWSECLEDYQKKSNNLEWIKDHLPSEHAKIEKTAQSSDGSYQLQMGPYWEKIKSKMKKGKTTGQAVMETLEDCQKEAEKIPAK